jgi:alpha-mannosidase
VSLVWGSQILQQIAQEVRYSENKIISAEKLAAMAKFTGHTYPADDFETAWHTFIIITAP